MLHLRRVQQLPSKTSLPTVTRLPEFPKPSTALASQQSRGVALFNDATLVQDSTVSKSTIVSRRCATDLRITHRLPLAISLLQIPQVPSQFSSSSQDFLESLQVPLQSTEAVTIHPAHGVAAPKSRRTASPWLSISTLSVLISRQRMSRLCS